MAEKGDSSSVTNERDSSSLRRKVKHDMFGTSNSDSEELDGLEKSTSSVHKQEEGSSSSSIRRKDSEETVDGPKKAAGSNDKKEGEYQGSAKRDSSAAAASKFHLEKEALKKKIKHDMFGSDSEELDGSGKGSNDTVPPEGDRARFLNNEALSKMIKHDMFGSDSSEEGDGSQDKEGNKGKLLDGSQDLTRPRTNLPGLDSDKRDSSEEVNKRIKLDVSQDLINPLPETKPRNQEDTFSSHGSFWAPTGNLVVNKTKTLIYQKSLTEDDISKGRLIIPMESGRKFLPEHDGNIITVSFIDHNGQSWSMEVLFDELSSSYMLGLNWEAYVKQFNLEAGDMIFIYHHDPSTTSTVDQYCLIEYEKKPAYVSSPRRDR